jgi:hypothetical protein
VSGRVEERRRAAQLARHYCDHEGLSIAEIARRLGRAKAKGTYMTRLMLTKDPAGNWRPRQEVARSGVTCPPRHQPEKSLPDGTISFSLGLDVQHIR